MNGFCEIYLKTISLFYIANIRSFWNELIPQSINFRKLVPNYLIDDDVNKIILL